MPSFNQIGRSSPALPTTADLPPRSDGLGGAKAAAPPSRSACSGGRLYWMPFRPRQAVISVVVRPSGEPALAFAGHRFVFGSGTQTFGPRTAVPAEARQGRERAKGNKLESDASRTQGRSDVPSALERVREVARRKRNERFTALLQHVYDIDRLRKPYLALKRDAAAGIDGETWQHYGEDRPGRGTRSWRVGPTRSGRAGGAVGVGQDRPPVDLGTVGVRQDHPPRSSRDCRGAATPTWSLS